jgi:gliding motility-associated-like protein
MKLLRYLHKMSRTLLLLIALLCSSYGMSSHILGGDITWTCDGGGNYIFQLVFYRDCNGADVNTVNVDLDVWNHPTVSTIQVDFESRTDVSPFCTQVGGGPSPLLCGSGAFGGNGIGAIEKIVYRSAPIALSGTPPIEGWIFTYEDFSRNTGLTNIQNPSSYGITLVSRMYAIPGGSGTCVDNSPQFLQEPYFVSCVGDQYEYNTNPVDADLDSITVTFGHPLNEIQGALFDPPNDPIELPYEPGFSANSPTPDASMNPGNIPANLDPVSGNLTFLSNNAGNFAIKLVTRSYRQGVLIAEVEREMQLIVQNCVGTNSAPVVPGPFAGAWETTVTAGDLVTFNLGSTDTELLQDGSPQLNILTATGLEFGPNPSVPTGCAIGPCATLSSAPPISAPQGVSTTFNWQTQCDHLVTPYGYTASEVPYHFVFKFQDDYCPVPKVRYGTVTINVQNPDIIAAPQINCIQTDVNGDITIEWDPVTDINGSFSTYEIISAQDGTLASLSNINTSSYTTSVSAAGQPHDFIIGVGSACFGTTYRYSDSVSNIHLTLNNPLNGTAILQWNDPITPKRTSMGDYYHLYREYPTGVWNLYDSVPYGTTTYIDTITVCSGTINYQVVLPNTPCDFTSNIVGDFLEDMITPDIPNISHVSVDTATNQVEIVWDQNNQADTYGYVIYTLDASGFVVSLDTVWDNADTSYLHNVPTDAGPLTYTVAAFDSCFTATVPPSYQTSAKALLNTSVFLSSTLDICANEVVLSWTDYEGWSGIAEYAVYVQENGGSWTNVGSTSGNQFNVSVQQASDYCFVIEALSTEGQRAFSNASCFFVPLPTAPAFNYLQVATVDGAAIDLTHYIDFSTDIAQVSIQRQNLQGTFDEIARLPVTSSVINYTDTDVDVDLNSYRYRVQVIDSCGKLGALSNEAETILLNVHIDDVAKEVYLTWNPYREFDGSILGYAIYRGIDGVYSGTPIGTVPNGQYYYNDDVNDIVSKGRICYYVEAIEATNSFGFAESSLSNRNCAVLPPIIYIPNTFSPNDDGYNDVFLPIVSDFDPSYYELMVYNRYGQVIFRSNDPNIGWTGIVDGTSQMAANNTYLYTVSVRDGEGVEILKRGHINLMK